MGADQNLDWQAAAASALEWWQTAGVDTAIDEAPRNWLNAPAAPVHSPSPLTVAPSAPAPCVLPDMLSAFEAWRISADASDAGWGTRLIGPQGDAASGLMILIDMPEREDAETGVLMSGAAGRLFDRMLAAIGRDRAAIYLASLCAARPVSGQIAAEHQQRLTEIAFHHIALAKPKRLLLMGNAVSRAILGANAAASRATLHVLNHAGGQTEAVSSFHPRFLLKQPARKAESWRDLQMLIGGIA